MLLAAGDPLGQSSGSSSLVRSQRLFLSSAERARPDHIRNALIGTLFGSATNVATLAFAAIVCGWLAYTRSGCFLSVAVAILEVIVITSRCGVILAFSRAGRSKRLTESDAWLCKFGWLALASSSLWGALCFLALATAHDAVLYAIPVMSTVGIAGSVAARNSAVPRLAKSQLAVSLSPILVGCLFADDHGFRTLLLLVPAMAIGLVILINERHAQLLALIQTRHELDLLSRTDAVTGIANRRTFDEQLEKRVGAERPFALVMVDVDHFKRFNDTFGHPAGDLMLARIATILKSEMRRSEDLVARYGGEEFVILIDGVELLGAAALAERIRLRIKATFADAPTGGRMTASLGVAASDATSVVDDIVQRADDALYRAKRTGRDRVAVARRPLVAKVDGSVTPLAETASLSPASA